MNSALIYSQTPEQKQLEQKLAELEQLEDNLAEKELNLITIKGELYTFEKEYNRFVESRYIELHKLTIETNKYLSRLFPKEPLYITNDLDIESEETDNNHQEFTPNYESFKEFSPSDNIKKLYRKLAKQIHPDLATTSSEREACKNLMVEANRAYAEGNEELLLALLNNYENKPESHNGIKTQLICVTNKIAQTHVRIKTINQEIEFLTHCDLYKLRNKIRASQQAGKDLLSEMITKLDEQISAARLRLKELQRYFQE